MPTDRTNIRERLGLRPVINVSGTMTALGASIVVPEAITAVQEILPEFVEIDSLQRKASSVIARLCGAEAGCVTASCASGMTITIAGAMTGASLPAIRRLPDATGMRDEVPLQVGHMVNYGAPVEQAIRLAGGRVVAVGTATKALPAELEGALNERTAAALYVVSHHTVQFGQIPLADFAGVCHAKGVPVIVDAASEYDLEGFLAAGADIVIYSAHKFLGGPTAGIVAGRKDLVRAAYLQNLGIGRGMKVGKEGIVGTIAALEAWEKRDHAGIRRTETTHLEMWVQRLSGLPGIEVRRIPDPTENPLERLVLHVEPAEAGLAAWELADRLAQGEPPVIVRDHEIEKGLFYMDPCNLHPGEAEVVAERIIAELSAAAAEGGHVPIPLSEMRARRFERMLNWPD